jgi:dihydroneopterin aldolase
MLAERPPRASPDVAVAAPVVVLREVAISDIRVAADIGVYAHERGRRQSLLVDIRLQVGEIANDHLGETVDYNWVVENALRLGDVHLALIETFAFNLAKICLEHDRVAGVEVVVTKPGALVNGTASTRIALAAG